MCTLCSRVGSKYPISTAFPSSVFSILKNVNLSFLNATLKLLEEGGSCSAMCIVLDRQLNPWVNAYWCHSGTPASSTAQLIHLNRPSFSPSQSSGLQGGTAVQDSLTLVRGMGKPTFFLTLTCQTLLTPLRMARTPSTDLIFVPDSSVPNCFTL